MARDFDTPFMKGIEAELNAAPKDQPPLERAASALASGLSAQEPDKGGTFYVAAGDLRAAVIDGKFDLTLLARAVIEAIREPSEAMLLAGESAPPNEASHPNDIEPGAAQIWPAMIDALLEEER